MLRLVLLLGVLVFVLCAFVMIYKEYFSGLEVRRVGVGSVWVVVLQSISQVGCCFLRISTGARYKKVVFLPHLVVRPLVCLA